jgi:MFS family permease
MPAAPSIPASPRRPYLALKHRDFRHLWAAQLVSLTGSQMQTVAINWHVYLLTGSPLALGLVGLTRALPIIVFSLIGGVVADRRDRRRVMFCTQLAMTAIALTLGLLTFAGHDRVGWLYALNILSATAVSFDGPARQALVPRLVPREDLPGALSLNLTAFHTAMIGGPALAGLLIAGGGALLAPHLPPAPTPAHTSAAPALPAGPRAGPGLSGAEVHAATEGLAWIYALNALSFVATLISLATMHPDRGRVTGGGFVAAPPLVALKDGLRFVFTTPLMVWTMGLDFFATLFSGASTLLPLFADRVLGVGPVGYGLLASGPALGALLGSIYTSLRPLPRAQGRVLLWSVTAYGLATVTWGLSRHVVLTFAALAAAGLADLVSTVIRQTLRQVMTPDELRGRMTAVNAIFFMGGPQLGEAEAGLVADLVRRAATSAAIGASIPVATVLGVTVSVVSGGVATLIATAVVAAATPLVRNYDIYTHLHGEPHPPP